MLRLEAVNSHNVWDILQLHVAESQQSFVAPNDISLIEAYLCLTAYGHVYSFGIFDGVTPVGFVMIGCDADENFEHPPQIACGNYCIWRLMIDEKYQHGGCGAGALAMLDFIRSFPCGRAEYCCLSFDAENTHAKRLYAKFGFVENGEKDGNETVAVLRL